MAYWWISSISDRIGNDYAYLENYGIRKLCGTMVRRLASRLQEFLEAHTDGPLRSSIAYEPARHEVYYIRDGVADQYDLVQLGGLSLILGLTR